MCTTNDTVLPPSAAVVVTFLGKNPAVIFDVVMANGEEDGIFSAIKTVGGTCRSGSLDVMATVAGPFKEGEFSVTVPLAPFPQIMSPGVTLSEATCGEITVSVAEIVLLA